MCLVLTAELFRQQHYQFTSIECETNLRCRRHAMITRPMRRGSSTGTCQDPMLGSLAVSSPRGSNVRVRHHTFLFFSCVMNRRWPSAVQLLSSFVLFTCTAATTPRLPTTRAITVQDCYAGELLPMLTFFPLLVSPLQGLLRFVFAHVMCVCVCIVVHVRGGNWWTRLMPLASTCTTHTHTHTPHPHSTLHSHSTHYWSEQLHLGAHRLTHILIHSHNATATWTADGKTWTGFCGKTGAPSECTPSEGWMPWAQILDESDAPLYR